jgi:ParB family chromosome partitioning protein
MPQERMIRLAVEKISAAKQVREQFDEESIAGLAATLKAQGQLQPVRVRKVGDKYILVDGERRYRAAKLAGLAELDVIVEEQELTPAETTERSLVANCQREDLKPLEKARGIDSLMTETGWNASEVAQRLGMSNATVSRLLTLLTLSEEIQEQVASGKIAPSAAAELAKVKDADRRSDLADSWRRAN